MANLADIIPAFMIGPNGQRLTPEQIRERQQIAQSLMGQATDTSPNAGGVASILAKGVQGFAAGRARNQADAAAGANAKASSANVASLLGLLGGGSAAPVSQGATFASPMVAPVQSIAPAGGGQTVSSITAQGIDPVAEVLSDPNSTPKEKSDAIEYIRYANQGATRNLPVSPGLTKALGFLPELGITAEVFSGGQPAKGSGLARVGSVRHDHGNAADVFFYKDGRKLDWSNPQDVPLYQEIVKRGRQAGITGFGAGQGYMQPGSMHIGFGNPGVWGAGGSGKNAPSWLTEAFNGAPSGGTAQQQPQRTPVPSYEQAAMGINPAIVEALSSPYASEQERSVAGLLLNQTMSQQQAAQAKALKQQERQQEIARRQQIAQQSGIDPAYAQDDELWKGATGQIFAAPSTSTVNNTVIDNRTGKPIYQGEPQRQPLMNLGDGTVYDPNAPQDQRFIQAPNGGAKVPESVRALEIRAERAGLKAGTPEYNQFMISGGSGGTSLSVGPDGTVQYSQGGAGGKNLTEAQGKDAFFAARMTSSMPTLDKYEQSLMSLPESAAQSLPGGRYLQSEEYQLARDAGDDFVATYLRKDSGAALTKEEKSEYGSILLPQPGDKPALLEAKRVRRQVAAKAIQLGLPQSAVDNMVKAVGEVPGGGQPAPTTPAENPMPNQQTATGWKDLGNGVKIRPKGSN